MYSILEWAKLLYIVLDIVNSVEGELLHQVPLIIRVNKFFFLDV